MGQANERADSGPDDRHTDGDDHAPPDHGHGDDRAPPDHGHGDDHAPHDHGHGDDHDHDHAASGPWSALTHVFRSHSHDAADAIDDAMAGSDEGIRAVKISLLALGLTAIVQLVIALLSGSVAQIGRAHV